MTLNANYIFKIIANFSNTLMTFGDHLGVKTLQRNSAYCSPLLYNNPLSRETLSMKACRHHLFEEDRTDATRRNETRTEKKRSFIAQVKMQNQLAFTFTAVVVQQRNIYERGKR